MHVPRVISDATLSAGTWHGEEFSSIRRRRPSISRDESDHHDNAQTEGGGTIDRFMFVLLGIFLI